MKQVTCECLSCGQKFEVEEEDLRAGKKPECPNCGYEHCNVEGARKGGSTTWGGPIGIHGRRPDNSSFWPRH